MRGLSFDVLCIFLLPLCNQNVECKHLSERHDSLGSLQRAGICPEGLGACAEASLVSTWPKGSGPGCLHRCCV